MRGEALATVMRVRILSFLPLARGALGPRRRAMRTDTRLVLLPMMLAIAVGGCEHGGPLDPDEVADARQIPADILPVVEEVAEATNRFALDLYIEVRGKDGNLFFSPYSVAAALSMTYAGASGVTAEEMAEVLHATGNERWHEAFGALQSSLDRGTALGGYELSAANRLWGQEGYGFLEPFLRITREDYGAELARLDFARAPNDARLTINAWVEDETNARIVDLIPAGYITDLTRLVLTNAVYFKGTWLTQFDPDETQNGTFWRATGDPVTVPLMRQTCEFPRAHEDSVQVLAMPYEGEDLSMIVLLPDDIDGLSRLEGLLNYENLQGWLGSLQECEIDVVFPRFTVTEELGLGDVLSDMGMPSAFDPGTADFSAMTGTRELFVHFAVHKAYVRVNEEGTEAAAATGIGMGTTSIGPCFVADHPFVFMIYDHVTGGILFMGRVVNPLDGGE
jgi:serpin B